MTNLTGWQAVAREIGDYYEDDCYDHEDEPVINVLSKCSPGDPVGDWLPAEAAAKEILRLRERVKVLDATLREAASAFRDVAADHHGSPIVSYPKASLLEAASLMDQIIAAAERQQETDR